MPAISGNRYLTLAEMKNNADYIWTFNQTIELGWSVEAVSGMLGNMQSESTINPGIWQNLDEGNLKDGFGLVQWTPASSYIDWCTSKQYDPAHMNSALMRIIFEHDTGIQYYATDTYPLSFTEFLVSKESPSYLAYAFLYNYERPSSLDQPWRKTQADFWYSYLTGYVPPEPPKYKKLPIYYYLRRL